MILQIYILLTCSGDFGKVEINYGQLSFPKREFPEGTSRGGK